MGGLISSLLILASCLVIIISIAWFFYKIPLLLHINFSKTPEKTSIRLETSWGLMSLWVFPSWEEWIIEGKIGDMSLISKPLTRSTFDNEESVSDAKEIPPSDTHIRDMLQFIPLLHQFLSDLIHHIRMDAFVGELTYGTGDPATTGQIFGYYHAIQPIISEKCQVTLTPDFTQMIFNGRIYGGIRIVTPLRLIIRIARNAIPIIIQTRNNHA